MAAEKGDAEIINALLAAKADINARRASPAFFLRSTSPLPSHLPVPVLADEGSDSLFALNGLLCSNSDRRSKSDLCDVSRFPRQFDWIFFGKALNPIFGDLDTGIWGFFHT